jgi:hypothetical protein
MSSRRRRQAEVAARADAENLAETLDGKSFFAASMRRNLIDSLLGEKSRGPLQDLAFLLKNLVLAPQPFQLSRQILLAIRRRHFQFSLPAHVQPTTQRRKPDTKIGGDLLLRSPAHLDEPDGLRLEIPVNRRCGLPMKCSFFPQKSSPLSRGKPKSNHPIEPLERKYESNGVADPLRT